MKRWLIFLLLIVPLMRPSSASGDEEKAYARSPKEIAFQNDAQWEDNRWQQTDVGPFLAGSITAGKVQTLKGIAIRVGESGQAGVCFDTARLRISAAWTGEFLNFEPRRFGLIRPPSAAGKIIFSTAKLAGWAKDGRFKPEAHEITLPEVEKGYTPPGSSETRLPKEWAHYKGLYTRGKRVVLSYTVGSADVLESPWYVSTSKHQALVRSLEIGPSDKTMQMWVADPKSKVVVITSAAEVRMDDRRPILQIAPRGHIVRVKLLIAKPNTNPATIRSLRKAAGGAEDLSQMIQDDDGRFPDVVTTNGTTMESGDSYVIDTLTLPFENPWKALLFTAGHDFFSDGSAAICTVHGDVWTVSGIDRKLNQLRWRRFATGLCQPLGLRVVDNKVYVIGRNQITRLHDRNNDGEADYYENFNNDLFICPKSHDFVTCLDTDPQGNFYFIHAKTGVMKVSADGATISSVADGFRNPNGMGVSPRGMITAAPQQGPWTPESSLIVVKRGGYYGFGGPRISDDRPRGWDLPMCFIPRALDNSGGGQVWVQGDRWGPLAGQMLHLSYGQCRMLLALTEEVDGVYQGGTIKFPTAPVDFESGIMRGRFNPHDGQLYVSGLRGWQTRAIRDGCFQRVRYTGGPLHLPTGVKTFKNGIKLTFSEPLAREFAENPDNYFVEQWNYLWSKEYGSPDFSVQNPQQQGRDEVSVVSATLMDDGRAVFLEMPGRHPVNQISISWLLRSFPSRANDGQQFRGTFAHTINVEPSESIPESEIVRRVRTTRISAEVERRLEPGLEYRFESLATGEVDLRTSRMVALRQSTKRSPTPFLPKGPFSLEVSGTLQTPLSGFYDFRFLSSGPARLWLNDKLAVDQSVSSETSEPILLHKGHNPIRIGFESPADGVADLQLWWKGYNFGWEPVPPSVFFHDGGSAELARAQRRRQGRQLYADHHCAACHQTDVGADAMFELSLSAPDLSSAGDRFGEAWLRQWLISPHSLRPGTSMSAVLGIGEQAERDAEDIAAFLVKQSSPNDAREPSRSGNGEDLYEQLGCISCHHFESPKEDDYFGRISLYYAGAKYRGGALSAFLRDPTAHHAATRMPDFRLSDAEADALSTYVRNESKGELTDEFARGDATRGDKLFGDKGCAQCHGIGTHRPTKPPRLAWQDVNPSSGCLSVDSNSDAGVPEFEFSEDQRQALQAFLVHDIHSLARSIDVETSARLFQRLQCANCHDRDGQRSHRTLVIAEEGSGRIPETLPQLTLAGEKLQPAWTRALLAGELTYKSRPWIKSRMPAFPAYAKPLAKGLAAEHAVDPQELPSHSLDAELASVGEKLTLQTGLDCRQCHAIGDQQPRGDKDTKIALGINFSYIRERFRHDSYQRFMLDPPRYDVNTKMIRLAEDGLTTKLKDYFDADAKQQFGAVALHTKLAGRQRTARRGAAKGLAREW